MLVAKQYCGVIVVECGNLSWIDPVCLHLTSVSRGAHFYQEVFAWAFIYIHMYKLLFLSVLKF